MTMSSNKFTNYNSSHSTIEYFSFPTQPAVNIYEQNDI